MALQRYIVHSRGIWTCSWWISKSRHARVVDRCPGHWRWGYATLIRAAFNLKLTASPSETGNLPVDSAIFLGKEARITLVKIWVNYHITRFPSSVTSIPLGRRDSVLVIRAILLKLGKYHTFFNPHFVPYLIAGRLALDRQILLPHYSHHLP